MSSSHRPLGPQLARILGVVAIAGISAACSTNFQRFTEYPLVDTETSTASLPKEKEVAKGATVASEKVEARELDGPKLATTKPAWQNGQSEQKVAVARSGTLTVKPGQTLYSIAKANNSSVAELAAANDISAPFSVSVGQKLKVPGTASPISPDPSFAPKVVAANGVRETATNFGSKGGSYVVRPGDTLFSIGRKHSVHPYEIASANGFDKAHQVKVGEKVIIPGRGAAKLASKPKTPVAKQPVKTIAASPKQEAAPKIVQSQPEPAKPLVSAAPQDIDVAAFRWPVKGRVISSFGVKSNGTRNEGINIAVPEGTSVRSADDGIVAYSGNELKGYGNLLLIRHEDGWVSAYAHNKELFVKRGDTVRRGDVIAKAGRTGSVDTPQVHFELRKGATAVDPLKHLPTATARN